jgi:hypothetical protein
MYIIISHFKTQQIILMFLQESFAFKLNYSFIQYILYNLVLVDRT